MPCLRLCGMRLLVLLVCAVTWPSTSIFFLHAVDPETTLRCHIRKYTYKINKPHITEEGEILHCGDEVTVDTCWGRCDSSEIPDYKVPYKVSSHPVCTYSIKVPRYVLLRKCDPRHPEPFATVFDAKACSCQDCAAQDTSCEHLNG